MSQNAVSPRYTMGASRDGQTHAAVGTEVHQLIEAFFDRPTGPFAFVPSFAPVAYMPADCEMLHRERFPERTLERITPRIGPPVGSASTLFNPFSSFMNYFESRRLDREFTDAEISDALAAYRSTCEYAAPFFSSRGILWPFSTLTA